MEDISFLDGEALIQDRSLNRLINMVDGGWHRMSTSLQTSLLYSHKSIRWSLVSKKLEQRGQSVETSSPKLQDVPELDACNS